MKLKASLKPAGMVVSVLITSPKTVIHNEKVSFSVFKSYFYIEGYMIIDLNKKKTWCWLPLPRATWELGNAGHSGGIVSFTSHFTLLHHYRPLMKTKSLAYCPKYKKINHFILYHYFSQPQAQLNIHPMCSTWWVRFSYGKFPMARHWAILLWYHSTGAQFLHTLIEWEDSSEHSSDIKINIAKGMWKYVFKFLFREWSKQNDRMFREWSKQEESQYEDAFILLICVFWSHLRQKSRIFLHIQVRWY